MKHARVKLRVGGWEGEYFAEACGPCVTCPDMLSGSAAEGNHSFFWHLDTGIRNNNWDRSQHLYHEPCFIVSMTLL